MNALAVVNFPAWLKPEIIPGLPLRWYGLMYVVAFLVTWYLMNHEIKRQKLPWDKNTISAFFFWAILGLLLGARLVGTLLYGSANYLSKPWLIFWPFSKDWTFVGFQGMSFHGGFAGLGPRGKHL